MTFINNPDRLYSESRKQTKGDIMIAERSEYKGNNMRTHTIKVTRVIQIKHPHCWSLFELKQLASDWTGDRNKVSQWKINKVKIETIERDIEVIKKKR